MKRSGGGSGLRTGKRRATGAEDDDSAALVPVDGDGDVRVDAEAAAGAAAGAGAVLCRVFLPCFHALWGKFWGSMCGVCVSHCICVGEECGGGGVDVVCVPNPHTHTHLTACSLLAHCAPKWCASGGPVLDIVTSPKIAKAPFNDDLLQLYYSTSVCRHCGWVCLCVCLCLITARHVVPWLRRVVLPVLADVQVAVIRCHRCSCGCRRRRQKQGHSETSGVFLHERCVCVSLSLFLDPSAFRMAVWFF